MSFADMVAGGPRFGEPERRNAETLIEWAVREDLFGDNPTEGRDLTSEATVPVEGRGAARIVAREPGVVAGLPVVELAARRFGLGGFFRPSARDGDPVVAGAELAYVFGPMREVLAFERTALNFLGRLSGIASLTARYVEATAWTHAQILDTRKTTPGWRILEKYAVRCGGGRNHRVGLYDAVLIKDNHLAWLAKVGEADPVGRAVASAREKAPAGTVVEVEVDSLEQLDQALASGPDIVLLDNFTLDAMSEAVVRRDALARAVLLEASGGVNLRTVAAIARTGVDRISVGALTHSAPALDVALDYERDEPE